MPFSLTNAPAAFQWFMNNIFSGLLDVCIVIYLDNILIYSNNMSKHHQHVKEVLKHFCKAGFCTKVEKYKFHSESVEYLGYILSSSGLTMSNDKVLQTFTTGSSSTIQTLLFHWHASPRRTFLGSLTPPVKMLSTLSRKHSPLHLFLLIGFPMLNSSWKLMPQTML